MYYSEQPLVMPMKIIHMMNVVLWDVTPMYVGKQVPKLWWCLSTYLCDTVKILHQMQLQKEEHFQK